MPGNLAAWAAWSVRAAAVTVDPSEVVDIAGRLDVALTLILVAVAVVVLVLWGKVVLPPQFQQLKDDLSAERQRTKTLEQRNEQLETTLGELRDKNTRLEVQLVEFGRRTATVAENTVSEGERSFQLALRMFQVMQEMQGRQALRPNGATAGPGSPSGEAPAR